MRKQQNQWLSYNHTAGVAPSRTATLPNIHIGTYEQLFVDKPHFSAPNVHRLILYVSPSPTILDNAGTLFQICIQTYCTILKWLILPNTMNIQIINKKKLRYRRGTTRCIVSVEILPTATQQCSTTSPKQVEVMKLEG